MSTPSKTSGMAITALVFGILSIPLFFVLLPAIVALILGLIAASKIKSSGGRLTGLGLARTGWILAVLSLALMAALVALVATGVIETDDVDVNDLEEGQCVELDLGAGDDEPIFSLPTVPCDEPHGGEVYLVDDVADTEEYPGQTAIQEQVELACTGAGFTDYAGTDFRDGGVGLYTLSPTAESWDQGDRSFVCIATGVDGDDIVGSIADGG
jgi:hypothetical protein